MRTVYLFIILLFVSTYMSAQSSTGGPRKWDHILSNFELKKQYEEVNGVRQLKPIQESYISYGGSPFLTKTPAQGWLLTEEGDKVEGLSVMMGLYGHELFIIEDGEEHTLKKHLIAEVHLLVNGEEKLYKRVHPRFPDRFYEVLFEDDQYVFFKAEVAKLSEGRNNGMVNTDAKFLRTTKHYITNKKKRRSAHSVNLRKKNMLNYITKSRLKACDTFLKEQKKYKLKSEDSYVQMLQATYYTNKKKVTE